MEEEQYNYHEEEIKFWRDKITIQEIIDFNLEHRVEVLVQADCQYHCYIDYHLVKNKGSYEIALTFFGALAGGIYKYKKNGR